mmetsp:Transcript_10319/g.28481  ORF Transcript_10319/g.28481 Transcript_10319/m.28481 type:complete len:443 (-) Transcript_10319:2210-3538(-)
MVKVEPSMEPSLMAFRGPLILAGVGAWIIVQLCLLLSWQTILATLLLGLGAVVTLYDSYGILLEEARTLLKHKIDSVALDDILRTVHHAESDFLAVWVGTIVGQLSMYGLPCSTEQRVRLLQSGLEISTETEARNILMERGGWKWFLPDPVQNWIYQQPQLPLLLKEDGVATTTKNAEQAEDAQQTPVKTSTSQTEYRLVYSPDSDGDSQQSQESQPEDASDIFQSEKDRIRARQLFVGEVSSRIGVTPRKKGPSSAEPANHHEEPTNRSVSSHQPLASPLNVFGSVLKEMVLDAIQPYISPVFSTQDTTLEVAGAISSVAFFGHFLLARGNRTQRSQHLFWKALSTATTTSLASAWLASMACLFVKYRRNYPHASLPQLVSSNRLATLRKFLALPPEFLKRLVRLLAEKARETKWQGAIAAMVMLYWGHRRRQQRHVTDSR